MLRFIVNFIILYIKLMVLGQIAAGIGSKNFNVVESYAEEQDTNVPSTNTYMPLVWSSVNSVSIFNLLYLPITFMKINSDASCKLSVPSSVFIVSIKSPTSTSWASFSIIFPSSLQMRAKCFSSNDKNLYLSLYSVSRSKSMIELMPEYPLWLSKITTASR